MLAEFGERTYGLGLSHLSAYLVRHLPDHLHRSAAFNTLYTLLRDKGYALLLGSEGYLALPDEVRLWAPDHLRYFPADDKTSYWKKEGGTPGDWRIVELDGAPPDSIWVTCVRCCWVGYWNDGRGLFCPKCGWMGNEQERQAFAELEAKNAASRTGGSN